MCVLCVTTNASCNAFEGPVEQIHDVSDAVGYLELCPWWWAAQIQVSPSIHHVVFRSSGLGNITENITNILIILIFFQKGQKLLGLYVRSWELAAQFTKAWFHSKINWVT